MVLDGRFNILLSFSVLSPQQSELFGNLTQTINACRNWFGGEKWFCCILHSLDFVTSLCFQWKLKSKTNCVFIYYIKRCTYMCVGEHTWQKLRVWRLSSSCWLTCDLKSKEEDREWMRTRPWMHSGWKKEKEAWSYNTLHKSNTKIEMKWGHVLKRNIVHNTLKRCIITIINYLLFACLYPFIHCLHSFQSWKKQSHRRRERENFYYRCA